jgi:hypothetical protein
MEEVKRLQNRSREKSQPHEGNPSNGDED